MAGIRDWIDVETIQAICKHTSAVLAALLAFIGVWAVIYLGLHDGPLKQILEIVDGFILVGLFVVLGWKVIALVARGGSGAAHCFLVA